MCEWFTGPNTGISSTMKTSGAISNSYVRVFLGFIGMFAVLFVFASVRFNPNFKKWTALYFIEQSDHTVDEPDILFLETSMKPALSLREACSVESAAQHNPRLAVRLLSLKQFDFEANGYMQTLINISNVHASTLDLSEVFNDTPLQDLYQSGIFNKSSYLVHHLSDASRLAILWKLGGIYLDTDTITLRPLKGFLNALGLEYDEDVANGVMFFQKHHHFVNVCMTEFARDYQPGAWGHQGPELITRVLKRTCNASLLASVIDRPEACQGIRLLPKHALLPVGWKDWKMIVTGRNMNRFNLTGSYMLHFYGSLSHNTYIRPGSGVMLDVLASKNCPLMHKWMLRNKEF